MQYITEERKKAALERQASGREKRTEAQKLKKMTSGLNWKNGNIEINKDLLTNEVNRVKAAASKRKDADRKAQKMHFARQTKALAILQKP
jgi:hypothetical protein